MLRPTKESETDESEKLVPYDDISSTVPSQFVGDDSSVDNERKSKKKKKDKFSWKAITEKYNKLSKVDQDSIKTVVLLALVLMVMIRLATISQSQPSDMQASLRSSSMTSVGGLGQQPSLLQQQSTLAQNALLQQQQIAIVQAQQQQAQQAILLQAQAQKNAEEQLKKQQETLERQQGAILQAQQQQNHQNLLMQQTALIQQQQASHMAMMQALGSQLGTGTVTTTGSGIGSSLPSSTGSSVSSLVADSSVGSSAGDTSVAPLAEDSSGSATTGDATPAAAEGGSGEEISLETLNNFEDTWEPFNKKSIPIYWHIPKAGGSTVKDTIGACFRMVMATEFGVTDGHDKDTEIAVVYPKPPGGVTDDRSPFVNVDTTTPAGIERAAKMGFADSNLAGCVVTPFLYESNALFTPTAKGRLFAVFRHPVDRAVSMFYYIQVATWEPSYSPELKDWTLKQYAESDKVENNWMVRQLSNQLSGDLDDSHLKIALEVVRRKFMVGLMKQVERSMTRFERYFRWTYHVNPTNQEICRERLTSGGSNSNSKNKKEKPKEGDEVWNLLAAQNNYDLQLYEYAEALFEEQEQFVEGIPDDFRKIDGTCCKCDPPTFPPEGFECPKKVDA